MDKKNCEWRIRYCKPKDQPEIFALHRLALAHDGQFIESPDWEKDLRNINASYAAQNGCFLVAFDESQLIGMGALRKHSEKTAEIKRMRVHPDYQGQGLGQAILQKLLQEARVREYEVLILDTTDDQKSAQGLYEKNGFVRCGQRKLGPLNIYDYRKKLTEQKVR